MHIIPSQKAIDIYSKFKNKEGSGHIATSTSIEVLLRLNPQTVLEMGGGIGTLTHTLASLGSKVDVYEYNTYCQEQLSKNVSDYTLLKDYNISPPKREYDLVIVDGGSGKQHHVGNTHDGGTVDTVNNILNNLENIKDVYIEGVRNIQRTRVRKILKNKYIYTLTNFTGDMKGGLMIHCRKSKNPIFKWVNYIFWELMEGASIKNFIIYRTRRYLKKIK